MNVFRLVLFAVGLMIFLAVRFFWGGPDSERGLPADPPSIPRATPAEAPNLPHPFLHDTSEKVFASVGRGR